MIQDKELYKKIRERVSIDEHNIVNLDIVLGDGDKISHVGIKERDFIIYGCGIKIGCIGGVATEEDYRELGLATRLMKLAIKQIDQDQGDVMLVSGDRDLYRRQGCMSAAPIYRFNVTRIDIAEAGETEIELIPFKNGNILDIVSLHQKEPVRFYRTLEDFRALLYRITPAPFWTQTDIFMIQDRDKILGYLVTQEPRDEQRGKGRVRAISEFAGDRTAIAESIKSLFEKYGIEELIFFVPQYDIEFLNKLDRMGIKGEKGNLQWHTFKIINLPRFMDKLAPYIEERIGNEGTKLLSFRQDGDRFSIKYRDKNLELDDESIVQLVFGTYDEAEKRIIDGAGEMSEILKALFPLPFIYPGLNSF
jgi:hypothetical protein